MMLGVHLDNPTNIDVSDPVSDQFYSFFRDVARQNMLVYERVFKTLPSDHVRKFDQFETYNGSPKLKDTDPLQV
jgi:hypothetical protein